MICMICQWCETIIGEVGPSHKRPSYLRHVMSMRDVAGGKKRIPDVSLNIRKVLYSYIMKTIGIFWDMVVLSMKTAGSFGYCC